MARFKPFCQSTEGTINPPGSVQYRNSWTMMPGTCVTLPASFDPNDEFFMYVSPVPGASQQRYQIRVTGSGIGTANFCQLSNA